MCKIAIIVSLPLKCFPILSIGFYTNPFGPANPLFWDNQRFKFPGSANLVTIRIWMSPASGSSTLPGNFNPIGWPHCHRYWFSWAAEGLDHGFLILCVATPRTRGIVSFGSLLDMQDLRHLLNQSLHCNKNPMHGGIWNLLSCIHWHLYSGHLSFYF